MIQTKRHLLVDINDSDLRNIYRGLGDTRVTQHYGVHFDSEESTKDQMKWYRDLQESQSGIWWKILRIKTGHFVGACGFNNWEHEKKMAEIGIWILPRFWGKGIMSEVLAWVIRYGFDRMDLETIEAFVEPANVQCRQALLKTEMIPEGIKKASEITEGKKVDYDVYRIYKFQ